MTKLLQNKSIIKFLGIALSILLIVALVPQINIAYGSKDDVLADTGTEESVEDTDDLEGAEGAENAEGEEEGVLSEENVLDGATLDGEEPPAGEEAGIMATALPEENPDAGAETPADTTSTALANNESHTIEGDVTNTSSPLTFSGNGAYTLTVNGTLHSDIRVTSGATLSIVGAGTIQGSGISSVIAIVGSNSKVILGTENGVGPTVTGGKGSESPGNFNNGAGTVGGGVFVNDGASFIMHSGAITKNEAGAGGGVFVWNGCHFEMTGGEISSNKAKDPDKTDDSDGPLRAHEGGGIFTDAKDTKITGGSIINNETETTTDWGGGGIYINNNGTLMIPSALITNNSAAGLGGGVAGCPHAKIIIGEKETTSAGQLESSAAVFKNTASGTSYPLNTVLRFNVPASVVSSGKNVPSGDFFLTGMGEGEIDKLLNGENPGNVVDGKLTYGWSTKYTLENKDYVSKSFKVDLAQDYYCTLASYVSADNTLVRGDGETLAWRGFEVGMPPVNGCSVSDTGLWSREIGIPVGQSYESHDATLCLTNTATADNVNIARSVIITGNKSGTHGGGIACNGAIKFGKFVTEEKTTVNPYTVSLTKKIVNSLGDLLDIGSDDVFRFELTDKETNETYEGYTENGDLKFILPGFSTEGPKEKTFSLKEILTNEQKDAGFVSSIPDGIDVHVSLNVKKEVASYKEKDNNVLLTSTTYTTTVNSVQIGNQSGDDAATVTNTLDLKTSVNIPVTKIADGIAANTFTFGLKDVTANIDSLVDQAGNKITLKNSVNLAEQALTDSDETATIAVADSTSEVVSGTDAKTFKFNYAPTTAEETHWYVIAEQPGATAGVVYDTTAYLVKITTTLSEDGRSLSTAKKVYKTVSDSSELQEVAGDIGVTFTNVATPKGTWQFKADKFFYGLGAPHDCSFTLQEIERAPEAGEPLANVLVSNDNLQQWTASIAAADLTDGHAFISFPAINYEQQGEGEGFQNDVGDHYYLITEDGDEAVKDTTAYVVKVTVAEDAANTRNLTATGTVLGYADDINSPLNPLTLPEGELPAFYNTDTYDLISAASYSVYAASGEPVDQVCYVDPKIVKNLEGRAIKSGEFAFKLIQVANYNDTEGELISATTNDEFGMVDFDKANNVSGDLENPSCLAYTKPGTYYYRVIEDTSKGGMNDQSVLYSDQVITFTTVIEQDEATGQLVCTDMYYGWWDAAANQNVRFDEQYADYETQPGNIGDMSKLNPDWHPTINNKARPMDLQVRKTSVSDRDEGLVGATYALYMVNENPQGDIWLAEATSEEGGWITYKNVSLATNNLYYFKETAAPAGHTVSEFRSPYFYLVEDATSANGYALKYTDTKYFDAAETEAAAAPLAAAEAQALQAAIAAQAEATAADDQTKPGHSADGNILLTYDKDGGVYDETTQIEVNKLDTRTHEWVEGAKLVILDKESGKEVASWTSGKAPQKLAKTLNVGTTYLLREVEAPGEYRLANDVEFVIDNYGNVTITKGTENGNAELSDNTITLYDTMMDAEEVEQREHETTREVPLGTILAQTGDMLPILGIGLIVLASLIALIVAGRRRRAGKDDEN
ncbi:MAG: FctA domain-containing protein [Adlercreutzia sp.]